MGFLGVRFEEEGGKITPCLKLVRTMLETESWHASTHTCVVLENIKKQKSENIKSAFFGQYSKFTHSNSVRAVLEIFRSVFSFYKVSINENISFTDYTSEIRLPNCSKLAIN